MSRVDSLSLSDMKPSCCDPHPLVPLSPSTSLSTQPSNNYVNLKSPHQDVSAFNKAIINPAEKVQSLSPYQGISKTILSPDPATEDTNHQLPVTPSVSTLPISSIEPSSFFLDASHKTLPSCLTVSSDPNNPSESASLEPEETSNLPQDKKGTEVSMQSPLSLQPSPLSLKPNKQISDEALTSYSMTLSLDLAPSSMETAEGKPFSTKVYNMDIDQSKAMTSTEGFHDSTNADPVSLSGTDINSDIPSVPLSSTFSRQSSVITNATVNGSNQQLRHPSEESSSGCTDMYSMNNDVSTCTLQDCLHYPSNGCMRYSSSPYVSTSISQQLIPSNSNSLHSDIASMNSSLSTTGAQDSGRPSSSHTNPSTSSLGLSPQLLCSPSFRSSGKPSTGGCPSQESSSLSGSTVMEDECSPPKHVFSSHPIHATTLPDQAVQQHASVYPSMMIMGSTTHNERHNQPSSGATSATFPPYSHWSMHPSSMPPNSLVPGNYGIINTNSSIPSSTSASYLPPTTHTQPDGMLSNNVAIASVATFAPAVSTRKHPCPNCDKTFDSKNQLKNHSHIHESGNKFPCRFPGCGRFFKSESYLQNHVRCVHHKDKNIRCFHCDFNTTKKKLFHNHLARHHKDCVVPCNISGCFHRFHNDVELRQHVETEHMPYESTFKCSCCPQIFATSQMLAVHMDQCHHNMTSAPTTNTAPVHMKNNVVVPAAPKLMSPFKRSYSSQTAEDVYDFHNSAEMDFTDFSMPPKKGRIQEISTNVNNVKLPSGMSSLDDILENIVQGNCQVRTPSEGLNPYEQTVADECLQDEENLYKDNIKELSVTGAVSIAPSHLSSVHGGVKPQQQLGNKQHGSYGSIGSIQRGSLEDTMQHPLQMSGVYPEMSHKTAAVISANRHIPPGTEYPPSQHSSISDSCSMAFTSSGQLSCVTSSNYDGDERLQPTHSHSIQVSQGTQSVIQHSAGPNIDLGNEMEDLCMLMTDEELAALEQQQHSVLSDSATTPGNKSQHTSVSGSSSFTTTASSSFNAISTNYATTYNSQCQSNLSGPTLPQNTSHGAVSSGNGSIVQGQMQDPHNTAASMNDHLRSLSNLSDKFLGPGGMMHTGQPQQQQQQQHQQLQQQQQTVPSHSQSNNLPASQSSSMNSIQQQLHQQQTYSMNSGPTSYGQSSTPSASMNNSSLPDMRSWASHVPRGPNSQPTVSSSDNLNQSTSMNSSQPSQQLPQQSSLPNQSQQTASARRAALPEMMQQSSHDQLQSMQQQVPPQMYHPAMHRGLTHSMGVPPGMMSGLPPGHTVPGMGSMHPHLTSSQQAQHHAMFMQRQQSAIMSGSAASPYVGTAAGAMHPHPFVTQQQQQEYFISMQKQRAAMAAMAAANVNGYAHVHHPQIQAISSDAQLLGGPSAPSMHSAAGASGHSTWNGSAQHPQQAAMLMQQQQQQRIVQHQQMAASQVRPMKAPGYGLSNCNGAPMPGPNGSIVMNPSFYYNQPTSGNSVASSDMAMQFYPNPSTMNNYYAPQNYPASLPMMTTANPRMPMGPYNFPAANVAQHPTES